MKSFLHPLLSTVACVLVAASLTAQAQDAKNDPTGTWSQTLEGRGGGEPRTVTLTLKADGEKLTGKLTSPGRQGGEPRTTEITDGKVSGDAISFNITRQRGTNSFVMKYNGKVSGDSITGTVGFDRNGETRTRDWSMKRVTDPAKE